MRSVSRPPTVLSVVLLAGLVLAVALACKKKNEPSPATLARAAELEPKVTQLLAQVASLSAKSKADTTVAAGGDPKIRTVPVAVIGDAFLADPTRTAGGDELDLSDPSLSVCKYIVDSAQVKDDDIKNLETCVRFEYVAVIHQNSFTPPKAESGSSYTPGRFSGSVKVFHLASGELRALYSLDVSQSDQLELTSKPGEKPPAHEWERQAMAYLKNHVREAALEKIP